MFSRAELPFTDSLFARSGKATFNVQLFRDTNQWSHVHTPTSTGRYHIRLIDIISCRPLMPKAQTANIVLPPNLTYLSRAQHGAASTCVRKLLALP